MGTIEVISILNNYGKQKFLELTKNKPKSILSRHCSNIAIDTACPMFFIKKTDFDDKLKFLSICEKNCYDDTIMKNIQAMMGLPKRWGKYTGILQYNIKKEDVYKIGYMNGEIKMRRNYKNSKCNEPRAVKNMYDCNSVKNNKIKKNCLKVQQNLQTPFIGIGKTLSLYSKTNKSKTYSENNFSFNEYALIGKTEILKPQFYKSYVDYVNDNRKNICGNK